MTSEHAIIHDSFTTLLGQIQYETVTGLEIAAAAAAAGKALDAVSAKALTQDEKTSEVLLNAAQDTPEMRAAARTMAARIAVKERVKLRLYQPFARMLGVSKAYFEDVFPDEMADKTADIPDEYMITPLPSVAVPALQGLSYSFEEANLRELYLNLLATASDNRRASTAHPAFADVIKQLSAKEARLLSSLFTHRNHAIATIRNVTSRSGNFETLVRNLLNVGAYPDAPVVSSLEFSICVDNWVRLGLVEITYSQQLAPNGKDEYDWVKKHEVYKAVGRLDRIKKVTFDRGVLAITDFGLQFFAAVSPPPTSLASPSDPEE